MGLDLVALMAQMARTRPVFHSEADLQHALAWTIHLDHPDAAVRLETRPRRGIHLDLLVHLAGERVAVELKYLVTRFRGTVAGELFDLPSQGAHDICRHDVIKDLVRVEELVASGMADSGWVVALSNDSNYWRPGTKQDPIDAMFRLHEGRHVSGVLSWADRAGPGTTRGRDRPLPVQGVYSCGWRDYSVVQGEDGRSVALRHLTFAIGAG